MELLLLWVVCGIASAALVFSKGRTSYGWLFVGFMLGPIGLVFLIVPNKKEK